MIVCYRRIRTNLRTILAVAAALTLCAMMGFGCNREKPAVPVAVAPVELKKEDPPRPDEKKPEPIGDPPVQKKAVTPSEEIAFGKPASSQEDDPPPGRDLVAIPRLAWETGAEIKAMAISPDCSIVAVATDDKVITYHEVKT